MVAVAKRAQRDRVLAPGPYDEYRDYALARAKELEGYRDEAWTPHYKDLADMFMVRRQRFQLDSVDKPKRNSLMISGRSRKAARTLAAGMVSGVTSPARPWFRLTTPDADLNEHYAVKNWLFKTEQVMRQVFAKSNFYSQAHSLYLDLGVFGTSPMFMDDDWEDLCRCYLFPVGSYALGGSARWRVDTVVRKYQMTCSQLVENFGLDNLSRDARRAWDDAKYNKVYTALHIVEPNRDRWYSGGRPVFGPRGMPFRSVWMEVNTDTKGKLLLDSGYEDCPFVAPRWETTGENVYGESPGMDALGAAFALQKIERRKGQLVDKVTAPPTAMPASLLRKKNSVQAGDRIFVPGTSNQKVEPVYVPEPGALEWAWRYAQDFAEQLDRDFYTDLFLMIAQANKDMTATEVAERHEEKMLQLGPVVERLEDEFLDPSVDRVFNQCFRAGRLPPMPPEMAGMQLRVEYISIIAQAQKLLGAASMERFLAFAGQMAGVQAAQVTRQAPALDGIDFDEMRNLYGDVLSVPPSLLKDPAVVERDRAAANAQAQQEKAAAQAQAMTEGAKNLASAKLDSPNALSALMAQQGGPLAGGGNPGVPPNITPVPPGNT